MPVTIGDEEERGRAEKRIGVRIRCSLSGSGQGNSPAVLRSHGLVADFRQRDFGRRCEGWPHPAVHGLLRHIEFLPEACEKSRKLKYRHKHSSSEAANVLATNLKTRECVDRHSANYPSRASRFEVTCVWPDFNGRVAPHAAASARL